MKYKKQYYKQLRIDKSYTACYNLIIQTRRTKEEIQVLFDTISVLTNRHYQDSNFVIFSIKQIKNGFLVSLETEKDFDMRIIEPLLKVF